MAGFTEDLSGTWKILLTLPLANVVEDSETYDELEFILTPERDVIWHNSRVPLSDQPPLLQCCTYEVTRRTQIQKNATFLRFGSYRGFFIEFQVENEDTKCDEAHDKFKNLSRFSGKKMDLKTRIKFPTFRLTHKEWKILWIARIFNAEDASSEYVYGKFDLLGARDDDCAFSDVVLQSSEGVEFSAHKLVLSKFLPSNFENLCSKLCKDALKTFLHFCYGRCLPSDLTEEGLKKCIEKFEILKSRGVKVDVCEDFLCHCKAYKRKSTLKKRIISLVYEIHTYINGIISEFGGSPVSLEKGSEPSRSQYTKKERRGSSSCDKALRNENNLDCSIKKALHNLALGFIKLVYLSYILSKAFFEDSECVLNLEDQHEVIRAVQSSMLPIFVSQIHRLISTLRHHSELLTLETRQYLAERFIEEYISLCNVVSKVGTCLRKILEILLKYEKTETKKLAARLRSSSRAGDEKYVDIPENDLSFNVEEETLLAFIPTKKNGLIIFRNEDCKDLRTFYGLFRICLSKIIHYMETFLEMNAPNQIRGLSRLIERYVQGLPLLLLRFEEFSHKLHERFDFANFKFCFHAECTYIANIVHKCQNNKSRLRPLFDNLCSLVPLEEFHQTLSDLDIYDFELGQRDVSQKMEIEKKVQNSLFSQNLNLLRSLVVPPHVSKSPLVAEIAEMWPSSDGDVTFIVEPSVFLDEGNVSPTERSESAVVLKAHGFIITSRCEWFKRALTSGMKEAIEKKIVIMDTSPRTFQLFLGYLYSGAIATADLTVDGLSELLLLSDRYEMNSLKILCEEILCGKVHEGNVLELLSISDTYNFTNLKASCIEVVHANSRVLQSDIYQELSSSLKAELNTIIYWGTCSEDEGRSYCKDRDFHVFLRKRSSSEEDGYYSTTGHISGLTESEKLSSESEED